MGSTTDENAVAYYPIEQLSRKDASTFLIFLNAQSVVFNGPVDDPWFSAHYNRSAKLSTRPGGVVKDLYLSDEPASALGCTHQTQWCNPNLPQDIGCQSLVPAADSSKWNKTLWSKDQLHVLDWFVGTSQQEYYDASSMVNNIGATALTARYDLSTGRSMALPNNQWQIEVEHFVGTSLASLQGTFVESASGPQLDDFRPFQVIPENVKDNSLGRKICSNQVSLAFRMCVRNNLLTTHRKSAQPSTHHSPSSHSVLSSSSELFLLHSI